MIVCTQLNLPTEAALVPVVRRHVDTIMRHLCVTEDDVYRAGIIVTEACSNVVRHAYGESGKRYEVEVSYYPERLVISVTDWGKGFDPALIPHPKPGQVGGYGIYFIREAADAVRFEKPECGGNRLIAEILLHYQTEEARLFAHSLSQG